MARQQQKIGVESNGEVEGPVDRSEGEGNPAILPALQSILGNSIRCSFALQIVLPKDKRRLAQGPLLDLPNQRLEFTILNRDLPLNRFTLK